jgi:peptidoglycan/LPS O-acetylase OafA/YrhL
MGAVANLPLVVAMKAVAAQVIVLHHLSAYGPLPDAAWDVVPDLMSWLYVYGRMAVQVFLVLGGFLAARSLFPRDRDRAASPWKPIGRRYLRLAIPYLAALGLAIACAAVARQFMADETTPASPTLPQLLAHALLLQDILDFESLSAGIWYVAIDFQAFALMALLLRLGRGRSFGPLLVLALATASLFGFNRDAFWDPWALYFFGAYGLGAAAWWSADRRNSPAWLGGMTVLAIAALVLDFRLRIALALVVALVLGFGHRSGFLDRLRLWRPVDFLGRISFAVFLVHYPIALLANAAYAASGSTAPAVAIGVLAVTWAGCIAGGALFHRWVEETVTVAKVAAALGGLVGRMDRFSR